MTVKELVGEIKKVMEGRGISQSDLAKKLKITPQSVSAWFSAKSSISAEMLLKIAAALEISPSVFFEEVGDTNIVERGVNFTRGAKNEGSINYNEALENYRSKLVERLEAIEKTVEKDNEVVKAKLDLIIEKLNKK